MNRYVSILLVSLLFLLIFNPINGLAAEQKISIVPSQQSTNIDQSFTIQIKAENFPSIRAAQLKVAYNPNLLEVEEVTRGDVFSSGMMLPVTIDNDKGEVIFGAMHLMERNSFTGQSGSLVTIQFRAIGSGNADIFLGREQTNTSLLIVDADGKEYSFSQTAVTNANVSLIGPTNNNSNPGLQPGPQPQQPPSGSAPTQPNINPEDIKSEIEQQIKEQYQEELEQFQKEKEQQAELKQPIFPDISGHWARNYIEELVKMNVLNGYEDGSFLPERTITRAEFAKMIVTALDLPSTSDALDFSDQDKIPTWARGYIAAAVGNEIIFGYDDKRGGFTLTGKFQCNLRR